MWRTARPFFLYSILQHSTLSFCSKILKLFSVLFWCTTNYAPIECMPWYKHIANIGILIDKKAANAVATIATIFRRLQHHHHHHHRTFFLFSSVLIRNSCELIYIYNVKVCWKILNSACDQFKSAAISFIFLCFVNGYYWLHIGYSSLWKFTSGIR